jgi:hypothetical protein
MPKRKNEAPVADSDDEVTARPETTVVVSEEAKHEAARRRQSARRRARAYGAKARECGYAPEAGEVAAGGVDIYASTITVPNAKAMMRFVPPQLEKGSFEKAEARARIALATESITTNAALVTAAHAETLLRHVVNEAVLRTVEFGKTRVDATTAHAVIRPYLSRMTFTGGTPPKGLIRAGMDESLLAPTKEDEDQDAKTVNMNKHLAAHYAESLLKLSSAKRVKA